MRYVPLGRSGVKVSPLCLGTMMFGGQADEPTARTIIGIARDAGLNFIDTADVYNQGRSEEITGRAIADERPRWVVATKVGNPMGRDRTTAACRGAGSRSPARPACAASAPAGSTSTTCIRRTPRPRWRRPSSPSAT